ncbi:rhodanese-like domain-containing protein [Cytobacillus sp. FSL H8-0458]|uniref:rhodanese-like domain-containing protein n=1 Tax=Cytobacillus sp. FSL H8-0458 TaxID=2975346 RepID=UPI0030F8169E
MLLIFFTLLLGSFSLFKRYYPVRDIPYYRLDQCLTKEGIALLDVRDYNVSCHCEIPGAINLPIPYINRHIKDIPYNEIHLVASSSLEKNVGIRMLRKKGFKIVGFSMPDCQCVK